MTWLAQPCVVCGDQYGHAGYPCPATAIPIEGAEDLADAARRALEALQVRRLPLDRTDVSFAMEKLAEAIGARFGALGLTEPGPASDAWLEALAKLRELRIAIDRAVKAETP